MIERPTERSQRLDGVSKSVTTLQEIAIRIDNINPETIQAIELAETSEEKANAIHAAIAEAMNARVSKQSN